MDASLPPTPQRQRSGEAGSLAQEPRARDAKGNDAARGRVPDFFIVGHQKSGTTALWEMLRTHPQIFMPRVKEPRYFAFDMRSRIRPPMLGYRQSLEGYLKLFAGAKPDQLVGEGSPQYLRSLVAAEEIARIAPRARIIAILREPASFLRSFHLQAVHNHVESESDLGKALALEAQRRSGRRIPRRCHHPQDLLYLEHVRYVEQLQRYRAVFDDDQVLVLVYDDFRRDNVNTVRTALRFLEVDDSLPIAPIETKPVKAVRSTSMHKLRGALGHRARVASRAGPVSRTLVGLVPARVSSKSAALLRRAAYDSARPHDERLILDLRRRVKPEVVALSEYLGRDLVALWGYDRVG